jgi:A/G-specific adenine glycosylase
MREDGAWLLETRPDGGLLGGMLGWPGTDWSGSPQGDPPAQGDWNEVGAEVRHTFTHFHLRLAIRAARLTADTIPDRGRFVPAGDFHPSKLPTVMRKAFDLARSELWSD